MKPSDKFKQALIKARNTYPTPKFKKGDVIMCRKYNVISLVTEILIGDDFSYVDAKGNMFKNVATNYKLKDIKNENSKQNIKNKPPRIRAVDVIDHFYEKVDAEVAQILYGVD